MQIDALIDDVVRHIFTFLPLQTRAKIGEVCKKWFGASRHASLWTVVEHDFPAVKTSILRAAQVSGTNSTYYAMDTFAPFLAKYATSLVDLNLSYTANPNRADRLDPLFQIKSLRRMKISEHPNYNDMPFRSLHIPASSNLELLNLDTRLKEDTLSTLLQGLPNLKELYIARTIINKVSGQLKHALSVTTKLERLVLQLPRSSDAILQTLKEACPSLRYIVYTPLYSRNYAGDDSDDEEIGHDMFKTIGDNAIAVVPDAFSEVSLRSYYRVLGPLLVPYMTGPRTKSYLAALACDYFANKQLIHYLVQEQHFDLNAECPKRFYRPSFQAHYSYNQMRDHNFKFALEAALRGKDTDLKAVSELIALGASAECPLKGHSYLASAKRVDVRMYLIQHGADPNKLIDYKVEELTTKIQPVSNTTLIPAFAMHFINPTFQDSGEYVTSLHGKVDFDVVVLGKSLLQSAIQNKKWASVSALMALGVKVDQDSLLALLQGEKKRFQDLLVNNTVDVKSLPVKVVIEAIHNNLAPFLTEYLRANIDKKNECGYNLLHCLAVTWWKNLNIPEYKTNKAKERWVVVNTKTPMTEKSDDLWRGLSVQELKNMAQISQAPILKPRPVLDPATHGPAVQEQYLPKLVTFGERLPVYQEDHDDDEDIIKEYIDDFEEEDEIVLMDEDEYDEDEEEDYMAIASDEDKNKVVQFGEKQEKDVVIEDANEGIELYKEDEEEEDEDDEDEEFPEISDETKEKIRLARQLVLRRLLERKKIEEKDFDWQELLSLCDNPGVINSTTNDGETALLLVCKSRISYEAKAKRVDILIANGANVNLADNQGWTPLHAACYANAWDDAAALIKAKANVNAQDQNGITPIMAAVYGWHHMPDHLSRDVAPDWLMRRLAALLKAMDGVDFSLTEKHTNRTFLHLLATVNGTKSSIRRLFKYLTLDDWSPKDADGFTPLHYSAMFGATNTMKKLVELGCDLNAKTTAMQLTPAMVYLYICCKDSWTGEDLPYKKCLTNYLTNLLGNYQYKEITVPPKDKLALIVEAPWNFTGFMNQDETYSGYTRIESVSETLSFLLENSDLTLVDGNGNSYLHYLVGLHYKKPEEVLDCCKKYAALDALWNKKNYSHSSPFHLWNQVIRQPNDELVGPIVDIIEKHNIDLLEQDASGRSIFLWMCSTNSFRFHPELWSRLKGKYNFAATFKKQYDNGFESLIMGGNLTDELLKVIIETNPEVLNQSLIRGRTLLLFELESTLQSGELNVSKNELRMIIGQKININHQDDNGDTALHIASRYFTLGIIDSLNGHMVSFNESYGYFYAVFMLLDAGADPTIKNKRGETPLSYVPRLMEYYEELYKKWLKDVILEITEDC